MLVTKEFKFSAAHHLTKYHGKCERPHGHTYQLFVTVEGAVSKNGLVMDFVLLKKAVEKYVISKVDHTDLNDRFENPSAETIAIWIWNELASKREFSKAKLFEVKLFEEPGSSVTYCGA